MKYKMILTRDFFLQNTVEVASKLIGTQINFYNQNLRSSYIITETEAYHGLEDEASHGFCGKTKRNRAMFLRGGHCYVYLIYGIHYCMNVVTEEEDYPAAVLIRGLYNIESKHYISGSGNVCKKLGINLSYNGIDLMDKDSVILFSIPDGYDIVQQNNIIIEKRIGITKNIDKPWRFKSKN